jgi:GNAT superfamily N-acetyltransferase
VTENTLTRGRLSDEDVRREIEDTGRGWVIDDDGQIKAFAIGNAESGNIWALFVSPAEQGMRYGHRLHEVMIEWLRAQNAPTLWLTTGSTTRACGFYERRGWQRVSVNESGEARYEMPGSSPLMIST